MEAKLMFQILMLTGFLWNSMSRPGSGDQFAPLLRTVVDDDMGDVNEVPPNSHISGPNGYCLDVKDGDFSDGNPIIIWTCRQGQVNQLWTFASDGTLRAKGKCLTVSEARRGSSIVIHNCSTVVYAASIWELKSSGLIRNPAIGLVITAFTPTAGSKVTAETKIYSSYQTWLVSNNTRPSLVSIIGFQNLCLQDTDDNFSENVWITDCDTTKPQQQWLLYPDGTIRPKLKTNGCLSYTYVTDERVVVLTCGLGPSSQRWVYTASRTLWNKRVNLVMDVKSSDPSLKQIIVYKANGKPNQEWKIKDLAY